MRACNSSSGAGGIMVAHDYANFTRPARFIQENWFPRSLLRTLGSVGKRGFRSGRPPCRPSVGRDADRYRGFPTEPESTTHRTSAWRKLRSCRFGKRGQEVLRACVRSLGEAIDNSPGREPWDEVPRATPAPEGRQKPFDERGFCRPSGAGNRDANRTQGLRPGLDACAPPGLKGSFSQML